LNSKLAQRGCASSRHIKRLLLSHVCLLVVGLAAAMSAAPAAAKFVVKHKLARKHAERVSKLPFGDIPKGPLEIFVSIDQQKLHFYSDGVHVADEPVATGVPGHLTPLGVFDVIQRDRYHHSNIYDNAPMPYMERITWSGVALHEGVGLGHQASHGCIRMPHDFAARLWMLPTLGMRVIVARPELRPIEFADPHLFVHKDAPSKPTVSLPAPVETAQAAAPGIRTDIIDAPPGHAENAPTTAAPKTDGVARSAEPTTNAEPSLAGIAKQPVTDAMQPGTRPDVTPAAPAQTTVAPATPYAPAPTTPGTGTGTEASTPAAPTMPAPAEAASGAPSPADITAPISLDDVPLPLPKPARLAQAGRAPIAIFVSRKTKKIYVRQNFAPLFDAPVTIENPDQPLGTHVFTALDYLPDHSTFRWTVTSLPGAVSKEVEHWKYIRDAYGRLHRVRVEERVEEPQPPPETPQEALARIEIPQNVIDQISWLIVPGSSLIISDQGLGPETDSSGTDFIVVTR
jgi:hypothetical protein